MRSARGNLRLAWSVTFFVVAASFLAFCVYHFIALPRPAADWRPLRPPCDRRQLVTRLPRSLCRFLSQAADRRDPCVSAAVSISGSAAREADDALLARSARGRRLGAHHWRSRICLRHRRRGDAHAGRNDWRLRRRARRTGTLPVADGTGDPPAEPRVFVPGLRPARKLAG